jgi:hypothetical protein
MLVVLGAGGGGGTEEPCSIFAASICGFLPRDRRGMDGPHAARSKQGGRWDCLIFAASSFGARWGGGWRSCMRFAAGAP